MIFKELEYEARPYMYTAVLDNGVTITAFEDGTADGNDGRQYRLVSYIDKCDFCDFLDEVVPEGWVLIE